MSTPDFILEIDKFITSNIGPTLDEEHATIAAKVEEFRANEQQYFVQLHQQLDVIERWRTSYIDSFSEQHQKFSNENLNALQANLTVFDSLAANGQWQEIYVQFGAYKQRYGFRQKVDMELFEQNLKKKPVEWRKYFVTNEEDIDAEVYQHRATQTIDQGMPSPCTNASSMANVPENKEQLNSAQASSSSDSISSTERRDSGFLSNTSSPGSRLSKRAVPMAAVGSFSTRLRSTDNTPLPVSASSSAPCVRQNLTSVTTKTDVEINHTSFSEASASSVPAMTSSLQQQQQTTTNAFLGRRLSSPSSSVASRDVFNSTGPSMRDLFNPHIPYENDQETVKHLLAYDPTRQMLLVLKKCELKPFLQPYSIAQRRDGRPVACPTQDNVLSFGYSSVWRSFYLITSSHVYRHSGIELQSTLPFPQQIRRNRVLSGTIHGNFVYLCVNLGKRDETCIVRLQLDAFEILNDGCSPCSFVLSMAANDRHVAVLSHSEVLFHDASSLHFINTVILLECKRPLSIISTSSSHFLVNDPRAHFIHVLDCQSYGASVTINAYAIAPYTRGGTTNIQAASKEESDANVEVVLIGKKAVRALKLYCQI